MRLALTVHLPLTSRLRDRVLVFIANLSIAKQTALAISAFAYAVLMGTAGLAFYLRKPWARWFTIIATSSLIPIEVYKIIRELHQMRVLVLVANIAIVGYLSRRDLLIGKNARDVRYARLAFLATTGKKQWQARESAGAHHPRRVGLRRQLPSDLKT